MKWLFVLLLALGTSNAFDPLGWIAGKASEVGKVLEPVTVDGAKKYLQNFGYVEPSAILSSSSSGGGIGDTVRSAVRKFQEFAGITPTGELDLRTRTKMAEPRCGVGDVRALSSSRDDVFKWKKNRLTYSIFSYSTDLPQSQIQQAIRKAFDIWSTAAPLDFIEVSNHDESADIKIKFASGSHGDPWPFDGKGGVLAHATMPTSGLLHFDESENWVYMDADKIASYKYTDLLPVAIHESGHVLGLEHARTEDSIMAPFYQETVDSNGRYVMPKLHSIDIRSIQEIYGPRRGGFSPSSSGSSSFGGSSGSRFGNTGGSSSFGESSGRGGWDDDDDDRTTTRRPSSSSGSGGSGHGLFGSLWSKWFGHGSGSGSSDRDRDRTSSSDRGDSSFFGSGFGGQSGFGRGGRSSTPDSGGLNGDTSLDGIDKCPSSVDAISEGPGDAIYLFQGSKVFEIHGKTVTRVHSLRLLFPNGPIYAEAAYYNTRSQTMSIFQSFKVYVFDYTSGRFSLDPSYPKRVPTSIGFNPTGAMQWTDGSHILFSRADEFAVYDEYWNRETKVDKVSRYFPGLPKGIRGGLADQSGTVKVFTLNGVEQYDTNRKMPFGSKTSIQNYLGC